MKEKDIRDHINAFLRSRLQNLLVPASMGIGLALGACNTSGLQSNPDSSGDSSTIQPRSGGAGGGLTGAGGSLYGLGGSIPPGSGGSAGSGGSGGSGGAGVGGTLYGLGGSTTPRSGGAGGGLTGNGGAVYGVGGFTNPRSGGAGGGTGGVGGTVYGTGGFKDAGPSGGGGAIDSGALPEVGKGEAGHGLDTLISEAGVVPPTDAKDTSLPEAPGE